MRHALRGSFFVAGHSIPAEVDAGREDQSVVRETRAIRQRNAARLWVDSSGSHPSNFDPITTDFVSSATTAPRNGDIVTPLCVTAM
jgi:hypothetical protein